MNSSIKKQQKTIISPIQEGKQLPITYVTVASSVLSDSRLSWEARGVYAYLASMLQEGKPINVRGLQQVLGELESVGYIKKSGESKIELFAMIDGEFVRPEKTATKQDVIEIAEYYKLYIYNKARITKKAKDKIKTRLKEYSVEELKKAVDNFSLDSWYMDNCSWRGFEFFFRSEDQIAKWLALEDKNNYQPINKVRI